MFTVLNVISYKVLIYAKLFRTTEKFMVKILGSFGLTVTITPTQEPGYAGSFSYLWIFISNNS